MTSTTTSPAHARLVGALEAAGSRVSNGGRAATCPAHEDRDPSLSIGPRADGEGVLVHCHAGCDVGAVLEAVKLSPRDLFDEPRARQDRPSAPPPRPYTVCAYVYTDEAGAVLFRKLRKSNKSFPQERPDGRGGWVSGLGAPGEVRRVLYRLPAVVAAIAAGAPVVVCEGEKDADNVTAAGWTATTWPEGASKQGQAQKWRPEYTQTLRGAHVLIVRDRDAPGRAAAAHIAAELEGVASSVVVVEPVEGKDVSDHLEAGHGLDELRLVDYRAELVEAHPDDEGDHLDEDDDEPDEAPGASWLPVDLSETVAGLLAGTITRPAPTVGRLDDGRALFYRGRVNGIAGASGAGKSWTALVACAQELAGGEHVAYIDLEDDEAGTVGRLLDLGAEPAAILSRFHYVHPGEKFGQAARLVLLGALARLAPSLAVVDSTGEAMALDGARPNDDDETALWFRRLPRALAARTGAAVVCLDHVVKADEGGLWPIGSQRKRAAITGAQYMQGIVKPFAQDAPGVAKLVCAKDRHGTYRVGQRVADVDVEPGRVPLVELRAPREDVERRPGDWRPTALMERIARALEDEAGPLSFRALDERVSGKAEHKWTALRVLVEEGHVVVSDGPRNARLHELVKPYAQRSDPRSDLYRGPGTHSVPDDRVTVSVSLERDTGHTHSTVSGTRSGHTGTRSYGERLGELVEGHEEPPGDVDEGPPCATCGEPVGELRTAYGRTTCAGCERAS